MRRPARLLLVTFAAAAAGCGIPVTDGPAQNGAICSASEQCGSGLCVDGVCCETACDGTCVSCIVPGSEGTCTNVPDGQDPRQSCGTGPCAGVCDGTAACRYPSTETACGDRVCAGDQIRAPSCDGAGHCVVTSTPCAPYACEDAACLSSCADPLDCAVTGRCLPDGKCEAKLAPGAPCASGAACASGYCADGVCCDEPCGGGCEACNLAGTSGTCSFIPAQTDPSNECAGEAPCGSSCNGAGACAYEQAGTECGAASCSGPDAPLSTRQCNGAGACVEASASCGAYACLGGACRTMCGASNECRSNAFCAGGACVLKRTLGESCANSGECLSAFCVDGVCCSSACGNACDSCVAGTPGLCSPLGAGELPQMSCGTGQACGQGTSCPSQCSATSPCDDGYYCDVSGTCQVKLVVGAMCSGDAQCGSGTCDDNVCCAEECGNTPCRSCAISQATLGQCLALPWGTAATTCPGLYACRADGSCGNGLCGDDKDCKPGAFCAGAQGCVAQKPLGGACTRGRECGSSYCVDGVCCGNDCLGACRACSLPGSTGTCTSAPQGQDPFVECPGGYACDGSGACNTTCTSNANCEAGFVCQGGACVGGKGLGLACTTTTECSSGLCVDGVCCNAACGGDCRSCNQPNAAGTCTSLPANSDQNPPNCPGGYTCGSAGVCQSSCATNANCKQGYGCKSGACVLLAPNAAACSVGADCQSGFCADGVCCSTACNGKCQACNVPNLVGACVPFPAGTDPASECSTLNQTCNGQSACGASCTIDQECGLGAYCNVSACAARKGNGLACTANNQCSTSNCVDGVCCNTPCVGDCRSCNAAGSVGTCTFADAGTDPDPNCPGGLACNGAGACNVSCTSAINCEAAFFCSGGACLMDLGSGVACTDPSQCPMNLCVDGVCCNLACNATCQACDQAGSMGTCAPYASRTDPANECGLALCSGSSSCLAPCGVDLDCKQPVNYCRQSPLPKACTPRKADGTACTAGNECLSGNCRDNVCCNTACAGLCESCNQAMKVGQCTPVPNQTDPINECFAYLCDGTGACTNPCGADADCDTGNYCSPMGTCLPKKANSSVCALGNECSSGNCTDGVCCNLACSGTCQACDVGGSVGTCVTFAARTDFRSECGLTLCSGGTSCLATCANTNLDCKASAFCPGPAGTCQADKANGGTCPGGAAQCISNICVDGVCCNAACNGMCQNCAAPTAGTCTTFNQTDPFNECGQYMCVGTTTCPTSCSSNTQCDTSVAECAGGTCKRIDGQTCMSGTQCSSGFCVDGVCCDNACTGNCRACNRAGSVGTCSSHPDGTDPENNCGAYNCDGAMACYADCANNNEMTRCKDNSCTGNAC